MSLEPFISAANAYCDLVETFEHYSAADFLDRVHQPLAGLYHAALSLPDVEPTDVDLEDPIPHDRAFRLFDNLRSYLGAQDRYRLVMEPLELNDEPTFQGSLADDLVDTYRDVKNGLLVWSESDALARQQVVWQWRFNFRFHWSVHASSALYVLSRRLVLRDLEEEDA